MEGHTLFPPELLEDWSETHNPLQQTEIVQQTEFVNGVNGEILENNTVTLKHRRIQGNLYYYWRSYKDTSLQYGEVYTNVPCMTKKQGRYSDVAYLTPQLINKFGEPKVFPQSFPLVAEIVSPNDLAEEVISKCQEYLDSGSEEVWLLFPENRWIMVMTVSQRLVFTSGDIAYTQRLLKGFSIAVDELLT